MAAEIDTTLDAVGLRLHRLRQQREMTQSDLAATTGISASTLSRLESGLRRPTLEQPLPLARAYGTTIDELVDAPATGDPRIHLRPRRCPDGSLLLPLTRRPGGIQAYKFIVPARARLPEPDVREQPKTHEGYEWVHVLNGSLRLVLGEQDLVLAPGEAAEFDTETPHWVGAADRRGVQYLCLFGRQGERAHVRTAENLEAARQDEPD